MSRVPSRVARAVQLHWRNKFSGFSKEITIAPPLRIQGVQRTGWGGEPRSCSSVTSLACANATALLDALADPELEAALGRPYVSYGQFAVDGISVGRSRTCAAAATTSSYRAP